MAALVDRHSLAIFRYKSSFFFFFKNVLGLPTYFEGIRNNVGKVQRFQRFLAAHDSCQIAPCKTATDDSQRESGGCRYYFAGTV